MPITVHQFAEKVALVINGSEGIGRAVALQLALQGSYVIVSYKETSQAQVNALEEMKSLGTLANAFQFSDIKRLFADVDSLFGRLDLLVNCFQAETVSPEPTQTIVDEALRLMKHRPKPTIVNVFSEHQKAQFAESLPSNFRQNTVLVKAHQQKFEHDLFSVNNFDDIARVVLFLLSSESKALKNQVLFAD